MKMVFYFVFIICFILSDHSEAVTQIKHKVRPNDEILKISQIYYGTKKKFFKIISANPKIRPKHLRPGQILIIPNPIYFSEAESPAFQTEHNPLVLNPLEIENAPKIDILNNMKRIFQFEKTEAWKVTEHKKKLEHKKIESNIQLKKRSRLVVKEQNKNQNNLAQQWEEKYLIHSSEKEDQHKKIKEELDQMKQENKRLQGLLSSALEYKTDLESDFNKKVEDLQETVSDAENKMERLRQKNDVLYAKIDELKEWEGERDKTFQRLNNLEAQNKKLLTENETLLAKKDVYVSQVMAASQEQVYKEKGRILAGRLWVEKNKSANDCNITTTYLRREGPKNIELKAALNSIFGKKNILLDPAENKIIILIPADAVTGIDKPRLTQSLQISLSQLSKHLKDLDISKVKVEGREAAEGFIKDENNDSQNKELVQLKQARSIVDYLNEKIFIPEVEVARGRGISKLMSKDKSNHFDLSITFKNIQTENLSETKNDHVSSPLMETFLTDVKTKLSDNSQISAAIKNGSLEIDFPHEQIFSKSEKLLDSGRKKLIEIIGLFTNSSDVGIEVLWVPGQFDRGTQTNMFRSFNDLDKIKYAMNKDFNSFAKRIAYINSYGKDQYRDGHSLPTPDMLSKKIVIRVVPFSLGIRFQDQE